ncbi:MAG: hypothetical protein WCW61_04590 [Patescibacteria group bacterium]|jgi:hypothetical protein
MKNDELKPEVIQKMLADYKQAMLVMQLFEEFLANAQNKRRYVDEWEKTVKERNAWLDEKMSSFELETAFEKKHPLETQLFRQAVSFQCFLSGSFSSGAIRKNTTGELQIYYSIEANNESPGIGFYLLLALYAHDGHYYPFIIAKSEKGCDDLLPTNVDCEKLTICNDLLKAEIIEKNDFTNLLIFCEEAINSVNQALGERLIKNY